MQGVEGVSKGYRVILSKQAQKDFKELVREGHRDRIVDMLTRMEGDPFYFPYEKLTLNLSGKYSRRITIRDRLVYEIRPAGDCAGVVFVLRMKGHYKGIHTLLAL